jgi:hypothetical protein
LIDTKIEKANQEALLNYLIRKTTLKTPNLARTAQTRKRNEGSLLKFITLKRIFHRNALIGYRYFRTGQSHNIIRLSIYGWPFFCKKESAPI